MKFLLGVVVGIFTAATLYKMTLPKSTNVGDIAREDVPPIKPFHGYEFD